MTPLRSSALALVATLFLTAGVALTTDGGAPTDVSACSGWTAYVPLDDVEAVTAVDALELSTVCGYPYGPPPEEWPPGAQPPPGYHPEIQVIR